MKPDCHHFADDRGAVVWDLADENIVQSVGTVHEAEVIESAFA